MTARRDAGFRHPPMNAPITPPATPAIGPDEQRLGEHAPRATGSASRPATSRTRRACPTVPTASPASAPNANGLRAQRRRRGEEDGLDEQRLRPGRAGSPAASAPAPGRRPAPARRGATRNTTVAAIAPPGPMYMRAHTRPMPADAAISTGWSTSRNCGTPKSNSAWKVDRPTSSPPMSPMRRAAQDDRRDTRPGAHRRPVPREALGDAARHSPTSDMTAPPMSMRCVGPQSVTSWPKSRCQTSSSGKPSSAKAPHAAIRSAAERHVQPCASRTTPAGPAARRGMAMREEARRRRRRTAR